MPRDRLSKVPARYRKQVEIQLRDLARLLQQRRRQLDLSQEALAEAMQISAITLQFVEQGRRFPSLPMLFYILEFLEIATSFELPQSPMLRAAEDVPPAPRRRRR